MSEKQDAIEAKSDASRGEREPKTDLLNINVPDLQVQNLKWKTEADIQSSIVRLYQYAESTVTGTIKGEPLDASELANVAPGEITKVTLALPVKEAQT
jgi:hypothetical protein